MKLYEELVAKQHPAVTWEWHNVEAALKAIDPRLKLGVHGMEYAVLNAPTEGLFPNLPWRTGCIEYGYYNTSGKWDSPTPTGWFYTPQASLHQHLLERPDEPNPTANGGDTP